jgi:hypothetical protein
MRGDRFFSHLDEVLSRAARRGSRVRLDVIFGAELSGHTG